MACYAAVRVLSWVTIETQTHSARWQIQLDAGGVACHMRARYAARALSRRDMRAQALSRYAHAGLSRDMPARALWRYARAGRQLCRLLRSGQSTVVVEIER